MRRCLIMILLCVATLSLLGQTPSDKFQPGTIMAVKAHQTPGQHDSEVTQYDVSVKVGETTYIVLFTPPDGANRVKYAAGDDLLVLVGSTTLTFNSPLSGKTEVPIVSHETAPTQTLDWTKAPNQYFSMKLQNLSEKLVLTDDQRAKIKPILEQEAGEVAQIFVNPVLSPKDKLNQYEKIVRTSDGKIKPLLSATQLQKLQDLRKGQKQDVKRIIEEQKSSKQS
jgi:hypothetical protein